MVTRLPSRGQSAGPAVVCQVVDAGARMKMVGAAGFEPATLCSQSRCATGLRYAPTGRAMRGLWIHASAAASKQRSDLACGPTRLPLTRREALISRQRRSDTRPGRRP